MLLLTQRTEASRTWTCPLAAHTLEIGRLSGGAARSLAISMPGGRKLDNQSVGRVLERSDGVPLFIEESANLEIDRFQSDTVIVSTPKSAKGVSCTVPPRLIDLLTERLDHVGEARETAGLAAAIGRQFPLELLESVSTLSRKVLLQHVQLLVDAGLVVQSEDDGVAMGWFKHALVRDSAYSILLESRRRDHHALIAEELERTGHHGKPVLPDRLAKHYSAAGNVERAFELWMAAGLQARRNSEQFEAISHFQRAERLIDSLPVDNSLKRNHQALALHLALVRCYVALDGYSSDEAYHHAKCAETLALECGNELQIVNSRFGLGSWLFVRGRIDEALQLATDCLQRSDAALAKHGLDTDAHVRDPLVLGAARASWACGNMEFHLGHFDRAMPRINRCIELCRSVSPHGRFMDQDPLIMCLCYRAWYEWESGDSDLSISTVIDAVAIARRNGRAFSIALSLAFHAAIRLFRGEAADAVRYASESIAISEKSRYATWLAWALVLKGRARCQASHERAAGIEEIVEGLRLWRVSGAIITRPFMLAQLAEACALDNQHERALHAIEDALLVVNSHGDRYYEAAIVRIHGRLLEQLYNGDTAMPSALDRYEYSLRLADKREQYGSALRSAIEIFRLDKATVSNSAKRAILQRALARIKSGFNTGDPRSARNLLEKRVSNRLPEHVGGV